jgi:hypothetical protein
MTVMSKPMMETEKASRSRRKEAKSLRRRAESASGGEDCAASSLERVSTWTLRERFSRTTFVDDLVSIVELRRLVAMTVVEVIVSG